MIEVENITVRKEGQILLDNISGRIHPGTMVALMGPNGSGKTTLLKGISGQETSIGGTIRINHRPIQDYNPVNLARVRGVLSQDVYLNFSMTALEIVRLGRYPYKGMCSDNTHQSIARKCLAEVDMLPFIDRDIRTLSGGERQRVHLARIFAQLHDESSNAKRFLLLDEPLASLDPGQQWKLLVLLQRYSREYGFGILIVMHELNLAARFADQILLLNEGKQIEFDQPQIVLTASNIATCFDLSVSVVPLDENEISIMVGEDRSSKQIA